MFHMVPAIKERLKKVSSVPNECVRLGLLLNKNKKSQKCGFQFEEINWLNVPDQCIWLLWGKILSCWTSIYKHMNVFVFYTIIICKEMKCCIFSDKHSQHLFNFEAWRRDAIQREVLISKQRNYLYEILLFHLSRW